MYLWRAAFPCISGILPFQQIPSKIIKKKHLCRAFYCTKNLCFSRSSHDSATRRRDFIQLFWASCRKALLAFILLTISCLHGWCLSLQYPMECTNVLTETATTEPVPWPAEIEAPLTKCHTVWWQTTGLTVSVTIFFPKSILLNV